MSDVGIVFRRTLYYSALLCEIISGCGEECWRESVLASRGIALETIVQHSDKNIISTDVIVAGECVVIQ